MPVYHKFAKHDFGDGLKTQNAILQTNYDPHTLILGTFNPLTNENDNMADFYYGRNWFWPALFNIFQHKKIHYDRQRKFGVKNQYVPSLLEIKDFCKEHSLTFADFILGVCVRSDYSYSLNKNKISIEGEDYDLINDNDLGKLDKKGLIEWTTPYLKSFIAENKYIQTVYFTRQLGQPFTKHWHDIVNYDYGRNVSFKKIFTPSAQGLKGSPRMDYLIDHWLFNENIAYNRLSDEWLEEFKIDKYNFKL